MYILGIDTSTEFGTIGIISESGVCAEYIVNAWRKQCEVIFPAIDNMLKDLQISLWDIHGFAVGLGPGSFTGVRIGVTIGKALAYVENKPLVGISTLDCIAAGVLSPDADDLICSVIDARGDRVYAATFTHEQAGGLKRHSDYLATTIDSLLEMLVERKDRKVVFVGDGALAYEEKIISVLGHRAVIIPALFHACRGTVIAQLAKERIKNMTDTDNPFELVPMYLRKSQAEIRKLGG
jgi:tRNA threonylcarbamoyladenosine biosynthesis protein TsaB